MTFDAIDFMDSLAAHPSRVRRAAEMLADHADDSGRVVASQGWLRESGARLAGVPREPFMQAVMALRRSGHLVQVRRGEGRGAPSTWQLSNPNGQVTTTRPGGSRYAPC